MQVYVDGDILLYRCAALGEIGMPVNHGFTIKTSSYHDSIERLEECIKSIKQFCNSNDVVFCLSHKENFRKKINPNYKANRENKVYPECLPRLRLYLEQHYDTLSADNLEADDILGIYATTPECENCIIVTDDKDLKTVPCRYLVKLSDATKYDSHFDDCVESISKAEALKNLYMQAATGDKTDGYAGIPGIGPKFAEKMFKDCISEEDYWNKLKKGYANKGFNEDDAILNLRMARILQATDFEEGKISLYRPPLTEEAA